MIRRALLILGLVLFAACGDGAHRYDSEAPPDPVALYGECAFCHGGVADRLIATGGHGDPSFRCQMCHADLTPGEVGPGHRNVPLCTDCHQTQLTHHDPQAGTANECRVCHSTHGSTNLALVRTRITVPSGEQHSVDFTNFAGLADGGAASLSEPGTGVCETCHTMTRHYRSDGSGAPHFSETCFPCHQHGDSFAPN